MIIGTGGRNVQQLQSSTGAHITVPRSDDASDLVTIRGSPDQIAAAQREIAALLTTPAASSSSSSSSSTSSSSSPSMGGAAARRLRDGAKSDVLLVPKEQHKYVIGPGGKTIRALRESTGAEIQLPAQGDDSEFVQLIGSDEQIAAARAGITEALALVQLEREKRQREYQEHTDKYYQFYQDKVSHYVRKRSAFFQQAEEAFRAGNGALAKELSLKGKAITAKIEKAQQEGAQALFKAKCVCTPIVSFTRVLIPIDATSQEQGPRSRLGRFAWLARRSGGADRRGEARQRRQHAAQGLRLVPHHHRQGLAQRGRRDQAAAGRDRAARRQALHLRAQARGGCGRRHAVSEPASPFGCPIGSIQPPAAGSLQLDSHVYNNNETRVSSSY